MQPSVCPDSEQLRRLMLGSLPDGAADAVGSHLLECDRCADTVAGLEASDTLVDALKAAPQAAARLPRGEVVEAAIERAAQLGCPLAGDDAEETAIGLLDTPSGERSSVFDDDEYSGLLAPPAGPGEMGRLGPYRVLRLLGSGGMGVVFLAEDEQLQRPVALKAMKPALAALEENRRRFLREARSAAALRDEHVVTIYQVGEDRGVPWLAMELLEGESLHARLKRERRLPMLEAVQIGRQVAQALTAAHHRGLIHRDIKPGNIMIEGGGLMVEGQKVTAGRPRPATLNPQPSAKLLDFGLARAVDGETHLTQTGLIVGTPAYMAPEQARGEDTDHRCDLFSLGCVLYHALSGLKPFRGKDTLSTLMALATTEVLPLVQVRPEVPAELSELVARLLSKNPAGRPDSAAEVLQILAGVERRLTAAGQLGAAGAADSTSDVTTPLTAGAFRASRAAATNVLPVTEGDQARGTGTDSDTQPSTVDPQPAPPDAESSLVRSLVARAASQRRQGTRRWLTAGTLLALAAVAAVLLSGVVFNVKTEHGTLMIELDDPRNVVVTIDGEQVEAKIGPDGQTVLVAVDPGTHKLAVTANGLTLKPESDTFSVEAGGRKVLTARLEPARDAPRRDLASRSEPSTVPGANSALSFDGVNDYVTAPLNTKGVNQPRTVEAWVTPASIEFPRSQGVGETIANLYTRSPLRLSLDERRPSLSKPVFGESRTLHLKGKETLTTGQRVHLAAVFDGSDVLVFVDGERVQSRAVADEFGPITAQDSLLRIGSGAPGSQHFAGAVDELRVSTVARYTKDFTPAERFEPDEHTLALYHFDEAEGDVLKDSSGNGHHGQILGATWVREVTSGKYVPYDAERQEGRGGHIDQDASDALQFDGVDDFVDLPTLKYNGEHPLTIELWARPASHNSYRQLALISNFDYRDNQEYGISLLQRGDTYPRPHYASWAISYSGERGRGHSLIANSEAWQIGRESHLAFVVDGPRYRFFIDGRLWRWGELDVAPASSARPFQIGGHEILKGSFHGEVSEVRISKGARYIDNFTPQERFEADEHTLALYHFDEAEGDVLKDSSGNAHHGRIIGATWINEVPAQEPRDVKDALGTDAASAPVSAPRPGGKA